MSSWTQEMLFLFAGKATHVYFHVTVMSLDSIDEGSMVSQVKVFANLLVSYLRLTRER